MKLNLVPLLRYFPKTSKTWLTLKPDQFDAAKDMFEGTGIDITVEGKKHLGAVVGSKKYKEGTCMKKLMNGYHQYGAYP